jgi:hypothetical protein
VAYRPPITRQKPRRRAPLLRFAASLLGIHQAIPTIAVARADPDISVINDGDIS